MGAVEYDARIVRLRTGLQPDDTGHNQDRQDQHTETHYPSTSWLDAEVSAAKYNSVRTNCHEFVSLGLALY